MVQTNCYLYPTPLPLPNPKTTAFIKNVREHWVLQRTQNLFPDHPWPMQYASTTATTQSSTSQRTTSATSRPFWMNYRSTISFMSVWTPNTLTWASPCLNLQTRLPRLQSQSPGALSECRTQDPAKRRYCGSLSHTSPHPMTLTHSLLPSKGTSWNLARLPHLNTANLATSQHTRPHALPGYLSSPTPRPPLKFPLCHV